MYVRSTLSAVKESVNVVTRSQWYKCDTTDILGIKVTLGRRALRDATDDLLDTYRES